MTENPVTIPFDFTVKEAAEVFLEKKISGAPVVDGDGKIIGVIIKNDLFQVLIALKEWEKRAYSSPLNWKTVPDRSESWYTYHTPLRRPHGEHPKHL